MFSGDFFGEAHRHTVAIEPDGPDKFRCAVEGDAGLVEDAGGHLDDVPHPEVADFTQGKLKGIPLGARRNRDMLILPVFRGSSADFRAGGKVRALRA